MALRRQRPPLRLVLYGRGHCPLCDVAAAALRRASRRVPLEFTYVDVDTDQELAGRYGERIPVIALEDGTVVVEGKVSETRVRKSLRKLSQAT